MDTMIKGSSFFGRVRIVVSNAFYGFVKKRRRVIVKNKVAHIIELILNIKKGVWKKHPPIEHHVVLILNQCERFSSKVLDRHSREIICAACVFIGECLKGDISSIVQSRARRIFDKFKIDDNYEITRDELKSKFAKWFLQNT